MTSRSVSSTLLDKWPESRLQAPVLSIMVVALLTGPIVVIRLLAPELEWGALPFVVLVVALEAILTTRWLSSVRRDVNPELYRVAEAIFLMALLRLFTWIVSRQMPSASEARLYILNPLRLFDGYYFTHLLIAMFSWERAISMYSVFQRLELTPGERIFFAMPKSERERTGILDPRSSDRAAIFHRFFRQWVFGGIFIGAFAALTTLEPSTVEKALSETIDLRRITRLGLRPEMLMALVIYFLGGLWLASQGRLAVMRMRWLAGDIQAAPALARRWGRSATLLILAGATIASFLPIGSTFGVSRVLQLLVFVLLLVGNFLLLLFTLPFFLISSLFAPETAVERPEPVDLRDLLPQTVPEIGSPMGETSRLLFGTFFWLFVIIISLLAIYFFLRQRGFRPDVRLLHQIWERLRNWWRDFLTAVNDQTSSIGTIVRRIRSSGSIEPGGRLPWRFLRLNALSPKEQVRYFYLSTIRRARERGVKREASETPLEFGADLREGWPEARGEIDQLTAAFLQARYSAEKIRREELSLIKRTWRRARSAIRKSRSKREKPIN